MMVLLVDFRPSSATSAWMSEGPPELTIWTSAGSVTTLALAMAFSTEATSSCVNFSAKKC